MTKTLFLHIGMHKTGTSAIQHALFDQRKALKKHAINYVALARNHSIPLYSLFADHSEGYPIHLIAGRTPAEVRTLNNVNKKIGPHTLPKLQNKPQLLAAKI